jgi:RNA polymerase sigma-70 factor (ECF subfamily)
VVSSSLAISDTTLKKYEELDPDVRLMLQVRDDHAAAFEELVARYQVRLISVFQHSLGERDQAEDLAQEVFLRVYRARKTYVPSSRFSTWLFTIAHNVASNARRSRFRRREVQVVGRSTSSMSASPLAQMIEAASGLHPTRRLDRTERAQLVHLAMETLSDRQRMALLLSKFEGMSYAEIGEVMELTTSAIKSLLSRARGNLRDILQPYVTNGAMPEKMQNRGATHQKGSPKSSGPQVEQDDESSSEVE